MRFFNTAGPVVAARHYHVRPLERIDVDHVLRLVGQWKYFVLRAPRQTGKTSTLLALRDAINAAGALRCVYVNVEVGQSAREDVAGAMRAVLAALALAAEDERLRETALSALSAVGPHVALQESLSRWAESEPRPLVLLIDEIDALVGDALLAVLRQLRAGYAERPRRFPQSVVLCGVRDKLQEARVRRVVEPLLTGGGTPGTIVADDLEYVRDLGLVARDDPVRIANPIYREVVPRDLTWTTQAFIAHEGGLVRRRRRFAAGRRDARGLSGVLSRALGALGGALPVQGGRPAVAAAGVPAAHRQQRRAYRAGVRPRPHADGPAGGLAGGRTARRDADVRRRAGHGVGDVTRLRPPRRFAGGIHSRPVVRGPPSRVVHLFVSPAAVATSQSRTSFCALISP